MEFQLLYKRKHVKSANGLIHSLNAVYYVFMTPYAHLGEENNRFHGLPWNSPRLD